MGPDGRRSARIESAGTVLNRDVREAAGSIELDARELPHSRGKFQLNNVHTIPHARLHSSGELPYLLLSYLHSCRHELRSQTTLSPHPPLQ